MTADPSAAAPPHVSPWAIPVLLLVVFMSLIGFGVVIPLLPFYASVWDVPTWQITLMFATFSLGQFLGELTWGRLSDRIGRRPVLLITIFVSMLGYVALAYAPGIWFAIAARGAMGFFSGNISTIQGYIVDVSPRERVAARLGWFGAAFGIGFVVGPSLGGLLAQPELGEAGFRPPLLTAAVLCGVACLGVLFLVRESSPASARNVTRVGPIQSLRTALAAPVLRSLLASTFVSFLAFSAMWSTVGLWGEAEFGWGPREIGLAMALTGVSAALSQGLISGAVVRRIGEPTTVAIGLLLTAAALGLQAAAPLAAVAVACMVAAVAGHALSQPAMSSLISRAAPPERQGATLGANAAAGSLARVCGPVVAGVLYSSQTNNWPILFAAAGMGPAAWLAWRVGRTRALRPA